MEGNLSGSPDLTFFIASARMQVPMSDINPERQRSAAFYGEAFAKTGVQPASEGKHADLLTELLRSMLAGPDFSLLDVGCGNGKVARLVKHLFPSARVVGIDIAEAALEKARSCPEAVEYICSNEVNTPFADATFDYATCRMSIHHYPDIVAHFAEMKRVLRVRGKYLILDCVPPDDAMSDAINRVFLQAEKEGHGDGHVRFYTAKEYKNFLLSTGLRLTAVQTYEHVSVWPKSKQYYQAILDGLQNAPHALREALHLEVGPERFQFVLPCAALIASAG